MVDDDRCYGLRCKYGKCLQKKQPALSGGTTSGGTASVSTLPSTGVSDGASGSGMLGMTLAGGAAALIAAKVLRKQPATDETQDS